MNSELSNFIKRGRTNDEILYGESFIIRTVVIFSALILLASLVFGVLPTNEDAEIYDKILRLHVIANSDNELDQSLKLMVRDTVLSELGEKLEGCSDRTDAETVAVKEKTTLQKAAEETLRANGCTDSVMIELGNEYYPTREYEGVHLPAGTYSSLRVIIGNGSGRNWWCVLFPALCTSAAAEPQDEFTEAGFTPEQIKVLTETEKPKYVLRFKILEFFESVCRKTNGN